MKQDKEKSRREDIIKEIHESEVVCRYNRTYPNDIDGTTILIISGGGIAVLELIWLVLRYVLHII